MSEGAFSADWLALREPVDHRSRSSELIVLLRTAWADRGWRRVLDLGTGTGSNVRFLAPRLPGSQEWTLLDHDAGLLTELRIPPEVPHVERIVGDLAGPGIDAIAGQDLVTASALLDLVTDAWLDDLVRACKEASAGAYFALTFDGTIEWFDAQGRPDDSPDDVSIREAMAAHQQRDLGAATALGPSAGEVVEQRFAAAGFGTWRQSSPWRLGPADAALVNALIDGWEHAARDLGPGRDGTARIRRWAAHRRATTEHAFGLRVGHDDLLALP